MQLHELSRANSSNADSLRFYTGEVSASAILYAVLIGLHPAESLAVLCARSKVPVSLLKVRKRSNRAEVARAEWKQQKHMGHRDWGSWCGNVENTSA